MNKVKIYYPSTLLIVLFLLTWEYYVRLGFISEVFLPSPTSILNALITYRAIIWEHTLQTLMETLIGLELSIVLGSLIGITIFSSSKLRRALYPLLVLSQTIPIIALAPLLLIWFGFDLIPKVIIVTLYCFFPIAVSVSDGLVYTDENLIDLLRSMKASRWQILKYVRIPSTLPAFFSGLRIATTYAISGAIVGEFVGAYKGLGIFMQTSAHSHAIVLVFASLFVTVIITLLLLSVLSIVEKLAIPWKK